MFNNQNELSQAIVVYLGYGSTSYPVADSAKIVEVYGHQKGTALITDVLKLTDEVNQFKIDWSTVSLEMAGKMLRAEIHNRYPFLGDQALDAIVWKFTFDWR